MTGTETEILGQLAEELARRGLIVTLAPDFGRAVLEVTNPAVHLLNEHITCEAGWYWWAWGERIAVVADPGNAADLIAKVLT